eukprot:11772747-Ditylum_brightwellii.AAC.1
MNFVPRVEIVEFMRSLELTSLLGAIIQNYAPLRTASVMHYAPVLFIITSKHQYCHIDGPMYQPSKTWYPHVTLLLGLMCTDTFAPSGAIGVASKLKQPIIAASAEKCWILAAWLEE